MRIPFKADDYFSNEVNSAFKHIQDAYLEGAKLYLEKVRCLLCLGMEAFLSLIRSNYLKLLYIMKN